MLVKGPYQSEPIHRSLVDGANLWRRTLIKYITDIVEWIFYLCYNDACRCNRRQTYRMMFKLIERLLIYDGTFWYQKSDIIGHTHLFYGHNCTHTYSVKWEEITIKIYNAKTLKLTCDKLDCELYLYLYYILHILPRPVPIFCDICALNICAKFKRRSFQQDRQFQQKWFWDYCK